MNTLPATRRERRRASAAAGCDLPLPATSPGSPDGPYTLGVRASHLSIATPRTGRRAPSPATVELTEISGSETFVHVDDGDLHWVVQADGVHEHRARRAGRRCYLDPAHALRLRRRRRARAAPRAPGPEAERRWPGSTSRPRARLRAATRSGRRTTRCKPLRFAFEDGGAYALLGPSGCGKTTLLNIISGLLRPSRGRGAVRRPRRDRGCRRSSATSPRCSSSRSSTTR